MLWVDVVSGLIGPYSASVGMRGAASRCSATARGRAVLQQFSSGAGFASYVKAGAERN